MHEFVLASGNRGKLAEIEALLGARLRLRPQSDFGVAGAEETAPSFVENALLKARHAAEATGLPAIADDSGLCVAALGGAPGVRSARYAGEAAGDADNIARLLEALADAPAAGREAEFVCIAVAVRDAADPDPVLASARWRGRIAETPSGSRGFGYDPVFVDAGSGATAAELDAAAKNAVSHRGGAFRALLAALTERGRL